MVEVRDRDERVVYTPRLFASVCAFEGGGKTEFACNPDYGPPPPIEYISVDANTAEIVEKYQDDIEIRLHQIALPPVGFGDPDERKDDIQKEATYAMDDIFDALRPVLRHELKRMPRTIVLDTGSQIWSTALMADHGKTVQILPELRTKTNFKFSNFLDALGRTGCNVLILHRLRDKYRDVDTSNVRGPGKSRGGGDRMAEREKVPGEYEREGFSKMGFHCNVEVQLFHDREREDKDDEPFGMRIVRCTRRPVLIGKEYWQPAEFDKEELRPASFIHLARRVYKNTTVKDWR